MYLLFNRVPQEDCKCHLSLVRFPPVVVIITAETCLLFHIVHAYKGISHFLTLPLVFVSTMCVVDIEM